MNIFQTICLLLIFLMSLLFYLRSKILEFFTRSLPIIFVFLIITTVLGLFFGGIFLRLSDETLKSVGVYRVLVNIDERIPITKVREDAEDLFDDFWSFFEPEDLGGDDTISDYDTDENSNGLLEERLYPVLVNLISIIYRVFTVLFSLTGMIFVTYLNYTTAEIVELRKLERRVKLLEREFPETKMTSV